MASKPLPCPTPTSTRFWEALTAHRIEIQQCATCDHWFFYPRKHCPACFSDRVIWKEVSGRASLLAYTIARIPTLPAFADDMPQMLAVIELAEGPHLNTTLVGLTPDQIAVGMPLSPVFDDVVPGEVTLLRYTAAKGERLTGG